MRSLKFHIIKAKNVLCFGPQGFELHFADYGNVVQVRGINLDAPGSSENPASNGAGKSSIQELLSIGLFGRTVKSPTKNKGSSIINVLADEGEVEIQWDDFRVIRKFTRQSTGGIKSKITVWQSQNRIWDDTSKIDLVGKEPQKIIDQNVGLSHHAFCNVVVFDDSNTYSFLEAKTETKREIVENLLDLEQYRGYHSNCKNILKDLKRKVEDHGKDYARLKDDVVACERRIVTVKQQEAAWQVSKKNELNSLAESVKRKQKELENTDQGAQLLNWQKAQDRIVFLTDEITDLESKRGKITDAIAAGREKVEAVRTERQGLTETIQEHVLTLKAAEADLDTAMKLISRLESLKEGTACPVCHGIINRENYGDVLNHGKSTADKCRYAIEKKTSAISVEKEVCNKKTASLKMMEDRIGEANGKVAFVEGQIRKHRAEITQLSQISKPEGKATEKVLEAEIVQLKKQAKEKQEELNGESPYKEIIRQTETDKLLKEAERDAKATELEAVEAEIPYYEFWLEAFGDNGIRKFVVDGIIPALNERIAEWLEVLIGGLIEVTFDNVLEETICRKGNPASYHNMSKGEIRRINLAVSQAFAYVMMLNSGCCPSVVFLDEITGGGIDRSGIPFVYNMIFELAKERQVFVTTHDENLKNLLQGCETVTLKKCDDITVLVS